MVTRWQIGGAADTVARWTEEAGETGARFRESCGHG